MKSKKLKKMIKKKYITKEIYFQSQCNACGICGGQNGIGIGSVQEFQLNSPPYTSFTTGCYGRPISDHITECLWPTALLHKSEKTT
jgi:hypothetical protein